MIQSHNAEVPHNTPCLVHNPEPPQSEIVGFLNALQIYGWVWLLVPAAELAYRWLFASFLPYDDEGYTILSLRSYMEGLPLYKDTFSQYGPFYSIFNKAVFSLAHAPINTQTVRIETLVFWLLSAIICAIAVWRMTRGLAWGVLVFIAVFLHCFLLVGGPGHPESLILFLTSSLILAGSFVHDKVSPATISIIGALIAFIFMTKINVGAYIFISVAIVMLSATQTRSIRLLNALLMALAVVIPILITLPHIRDWAWPLALLVAMGCAANCLLITAVPRPPTSLSYRKECLICLSTFVLVSLLLLFTILIGGTDLKSLIAGVLIRPASFSHHFFVILPLPRHTPRMAILGLLCSAAWYLLFLMFRRNENIRYAYAVGFLGKFVWGGAILYAAYRTQTEDPTRHAQWLMSFGTPFAWLVMVPGLSRDRQHSPRMILAAVTVLNVLLTYPVAGTQQMWATFLFLLCATVAVADAVADGAILCRKMVSFDSKFRQAAASVVGLLALMSIAYPKVKRDDVTQTYRLLTPVHLSGARHLRMGLQKGGTYHWLVSNLRANCDSFVAEPGYGSLHVWSEIAPVTGLNLGTWMNHLSNEEQAQVVRALKSRPRSCAIYNSVGISNWLPYREDISGGPLVAFIKDHYQTAFSAQGYDFEFPRDRSGMPDNFLMFDQIQFPSQQAYGVLSDFIVNANESTLSLWFQTKTTGGVFGCQNIDDVVQPPSDWVPILYVDNTGHLRGQYYIGKVQTISSSYSVNDGKWHHAALVRNNATQRLYLDGSEVGTLQGKVQNSAVQFCQVGSAFTLNWPGGNASWMPFDGTIKRVKVAKAMSADEIAQEYQTGFSDSRH